MRIAEKSLELTLCSQLSFLLSGWGLRPKRGFYPSAAGQPFWFGLTQKQEARAGFDASMRLGGGRLLVLQFKAGARLKSVLVKYLGSHRQLLALQRLSRRRPGEVFYVLPEVTETLQLASGTESVLARTWLLDVASIPIIRAPSRKSGYHLIYLDKGGLVEIKSDPVEVQAVRVEDLGLAKEVANREQSVERYFDEFWEQASALGKGAVGLVLPDDGAERA